MTALWTKNDVDFTSDGNIRATKEELQQIRGLEDFDLTMMLSEIHDNGWITARRTLPMILEAVAATKARKGH